VITIDAANDATGDLNMAKPSTFRVLMVWIDGWEAFADAHLDEELLPEHIIALGTAGAARRKGFLLLARKNWELEFQARLVRMPRQIQGLFQLPDGQAVDRLIGYEDEGGRWVRGIAGLEPVEERVLRRSVVDRWPTWEIAREMRLQPSSVRAKRSDARSKLRAFLHLGALPAAGNGSVHTQAVVCPFSSLTGS
jgi:hypothetical protein